ncbi:MAG: nucleotidyltransferase domain-containing protein [Methylomicrobium sp.]
MTMYLAKDFIETAEGLAFAVVEHGIEQDRVLCFLRYRRDSAGRWQKQSTSQAQALLSRYHPEFLYDCPVRDAQLHAVPVKQIVKHHRPGQRIRDSLIAFSTEDSVERDLKQLLGLYVSHGFDIDSIGVTGSLLIGAQHSDSDIDLVFYDRALFHRARGLTAELIAEGRLQALELRDWHESYRRRACSLDFDDYVWHERRKFNKALVNGRKFDLSFIDPLPVARAERYRKCGEVLLCCTITDDSAAFDYPALFRCDLPEIDAIVVFTATYFGQGQVGEQIEVRGLLEQSDSGSQRIVVGSSREAEGEYIKVLRAGVRDE